VATKRERQRPLVDHHDVLEEPELGQVQRVDVRIATSVVVDQAFSEPCRVCGVVGPVVSIGHDQSPARAPATALGSLEPSYPTKTAHLCDVRSPSATRIDGQAERTAYRDQTTIYAADGRMTRSFRHACQTAGCADVSPSRRTMTRAVFPLLMLAGGPTTSSRAPSSRTTSPLRS